MGRHARAAARSRIPVAAGAVGGAIAALVGLGLWLGSGQQSVPVAAPESAVVVSSLACTDGPGGTVVDVLEPASAQRGGPARADLDACGYQEGQQLEVQFVPDDHSQVVLAGNESAIDLLPGDRLPVGLAAAGLLALGAALAVVRDSKGARTGSPGNVRRNALLRTVARGGTSRPKGLRRHGTADGAAESGESAADPGTAFGAADRAAVVTPDRGEH